MIIPALYRSLKSFNARLHFSLSSIGCLFGFAVLNALLYQLPLYRYAVSELAPIGLPAILTLFTLFLLVVLVSLLLLGLLTLLTHRLLKPVAMLIVMANALALYFMQTYQVILDKAMMGNVFNTNYAEAGSYFHVALLLHLLLFGALPMVLIARIKVRANVRWQLASTLIFATLIGGAGAVCQCFILALD